MCGRASGRDAETPSASHIILTARTPFDLRSCETRPQKLPPLSNHMHPLFSTNCESYGNYGTTSTLSGTGFGYGPPACFPFGYLRAVAITFVDRT